jgi:hypothetical protein
MKILRSSQKEHGYFLLIRLPVGNGKFEVHPIPCNFRIFFVSYTRPGPRVLPPIKGSNVSDRVEIKSSYFHQYLHDSVQIQRFSRSV